MIPLWVSIAICGERKRFFRLWLPLFLLWILLLPFAVLALPIVLIVMALRGVNGFAMPVAVWRLFASLRGTLVDIAHPHGSVFVRIS